MEQMVKTLWDCVTAQGHGLTKVEEFLKRIGGVINAQGNGLRQAEARIARLEEILGSKIQVPVRNFAPPVQRALPASNPVVVEEEEEDFDYDRDTDGDAYEEQ